jgi:hypothetical protein
MDNRVQRPQPGSEDVGIGDRAGEQLAEDRQRFAGLADRENTDPKTADHAPDHRLIRSAFSADIRCGV